MFCPKNSARRGFFLRAMVRRRLPARLFTWIAVIRSWECNFMQNLFWKTKRGKVTSTTETLFKTEDEFERYVQTVREILSDIYILKRQVRAGGDIPDMVGVDRD